MAKVKNKIKILLFLVLFLFIVGFGIGRNKSISYAYSYDNSPNSMWYDNSNNNIYMYWQNTGSNNVQRMDNYWYNPAGTYLGTHTQYAGTCTFSYGANMNGTWTCHMKVLSNAGNWSGVYARTCSVTCNTASASLQTSARYVWTSNGSSASFGCSGSGSGSISYRWYWKSPSSGWHEFSGTEWNGFSGNLSSTLYVGTNAGTFDTSWSGHQFFCRVYSTRNGYTVSADSAVATIYVYSVPSITLTTANPTGTTIDVIGTFSSTSGISYVEFPTWTLVQQDDLVWHRASLSGSTASYKVKASEHLNDINCTYRTHVYAYTASGYRTHVTGGSIDYMMGKTFTLDPNYPEDYEIVLLEGAERAGENAIFNIGFESLDSPNGLTYEWHSYNSDTGEDTVLSGQNNPVTFSYTGGVQEYEIPYTGYYMLETWGAQGGGAVGNGATQSTAGGYGGYSGGMVWLEKGDIVYICVGGQGAKGAVNVNAAGGYNGGGAGSWDGGDDESAGGGGGATHMALNYNYGVLANYEYDTQDILLVAGGGGGSAWTYIGGTGGGLNGGTGANTTSNYPTQTGGYAFGRGETGTGTNATGYWNGTAGAGGGWYGGYASYSYGYDAASGGSGYIDGLEMGVTQSGMRAGNGQAKITYMSYTVNAEDINTEKNGLEFYCVVGQGSNSETSNYATLIVNETPMLDEEYPKDAIVKVMLGETNADTDAYFYLNILNAGIPEGGTYKWYKADTADGAGTLIAGSEGTFEEATNIIVSEKPPVANFSEEFKYTEKVTVEDAEPFTKEFNYIEPQTSVVEIEPFTEMYTYEDYGSHTNFYVPYDGYYTLELYGAQGGSVYGTGGKGGYVKGTVYLYEGDELSIYTPNQPTDIYGSSNGGCDGVEDSDYSVYKSGGAGATEVFISSYGLFATAGGGGGGAKYSGMSIPGGSGGGERGGYVSYVNYGNSTVYTSKNYGATQTHHTEGNFDTGWSYEIEVEDWCSDGTEEPGNCYEGQGESAGGGYKGGGAYHAGNRVYSGAGGSGYVDLDMASTDYEIINQAGVNEGDAKVIINFLGGQEVTIEEDAVSYYEYVAPYSGNYKIEAWGAQGGSYYGEASGGLGGYVTGTVYLEKGSKLNINIANQPTGTSSNGGGSSYTYLSDGGEYAYISPGAGSTYVEYLDDKEIYFYAGGGGGSALYSDVSISGGAGGGENNAGGNVPRINYEDLTTSEIAWMGYLYNSGRVRYGCGSGDYSGYIPAINSDEYIYAGCGGTSSAYYYDYNSEESYYNSTMKNYQNEIGVNEGNGKVKISYLDTESVTKEYESYYRYDIPYDGYYLVETWGAQGGSTYGAGGLGGYAQAVVELSQGDYINMWLGGQPGIYDAGKNGGGPSYVNEDKQQYISGGGGYSDTDIIKHNKTTGSSEYIYLYAGGGGGSASYQGVEMNGGAGGGSWPLEVPYVLSGDSSVYSAIFEEGDIDGDYYPSYGSGGNTDGSHVDINQYYEILDSDSPDMLYAGVGGKGRIYNPQYAYDSYMSTGVNEGHGRTKITYIGYTPDESDDELSGEDIFISDGPYLRIPKTEITKEDDGTYFYCEVDHVQGKFFSRSAELIVYYAPVINETKPDDATVYAGDDAVFMADVSTPGNPAQYQYQWYVRKGADAEPEMITGANGKIYTAENVTTDMDGWTYYCDIIHPCGTQKSREALLTVKVQLPVLLGPNYSHFTEKVVEYDTATFYVEIETPGIPDDYACTWQYRPNAASMWQNCEDAWFRTQCNYSQDENGFIMNLSDVPRSLHGYQFRLIVRIADGAYEVITKEATLTVYYDPIYVEPVDLVVIEKSTATFNLEFTDIGNNPEIKVTWFEIDTAGNHNQVKTETITSATTSTYSFTADRTDNGNQYYCVIEPSETGNITTGKANLTVCYPPTLDSSKPADMVLEDGKSGNFQVAVAVAGFPDVYTYQWYYATAGAPDTWNALSGQTGLTLTVNATKDMNGNRYKCVVSQTYPLDTENNYTSDTTSRIATLTVYYAPVLDAEYPKDVNTVLNKGVSFEVKIATAGNPNEYTYQWFKKANAEAEGIAINGATSTVYAISDVNVTKELNNTYYYCKVYTVSPHATYGHYEVTSRTARLVVYYTPTLNASYPMDKEVNEFGTVSFEVQIATDGNTTNYQYQWYENTKDSSSGGTPIDGAINRVLTLTSVPRTKNNTYYYCVVTNEGGEVYSNAAHLTVYYTPIDDKSYPKDITVIEGQSARFEISIATAGNPKEYTYTWERVLNGETTVIDGATNSSYTISKTTKADNGSKYFCVIGNRAGFIITRHALLTVYYVPELDASYPANTTVVVGNTANFEVKIAAKGNPDSYTYQWYVKENASSEGKIINGATNISYTTEKTTDAMHGYLYYCKVTNTAGTVTSREATLNVLYPVKLDGNYPQDAETYEGKTASFEVKIVTHGNPNTYTYQWYKATSSSAIGIAISGANTSSYTTPVTSSADNNSYYYCEVANNGGIVTSRRAKLTVYYKPILDGTHPQDVTVHDGNKATFTVSIATKGNPDTYTYQWFKENGTKISGATSSSYSVTGTKQLHETKYYCEVTNKAGTVKSRTATLFVKYLPVLDDTYPKDVTVVVNNSATFEVVIKEDGNPATYSYQWYENGTAMEGEIASTLTLDADYVTKAINKNKYYCVVINEVGTVQSRTATLHVLYPNELNPLYPEDVTVIIGETATFKVVIEELGTGTPSYQWYSSKTNKNTGGTKIDGATSDTYSIVADAKDMNNTYYYCVVSNDGGSNTSRVAKLTVYYTPVLNSAYPENVAVYSGQKATFEVKIATSGNPNSYTYQWYNQNGKISGATGRVYSFLTSNSNDKDIYYCKVTNDAGTVTSNSATLRVWWKATLDVEYPKDVEEIEGNNISFEVKIASAGNPSSYKFQWYMADKVGAVGTKISDGTAISYSTIAHRNMDEKYFYCTVTNQH